MNRKTIKTIEKTIAHWDRMIEWASRQPKRKFIEDKEMNFGLGETTGSDDCSLCCTFDNNNACGKCPLKKKYGACNKFEAKNLYETVYSAKTWGIWTKRAKEFRKQIASLLKEK